MNAVEHYNRPNHQKQLFFAICPAIGLGKGLHASSASSPKTRFFWFFLKKMVAQNLFGPSRNAEAFEITSQ
jgi:hypothetical protein